MIEPLNNPNLKGLAMLDKSEEKRVLKIHSKSVIVDTMYPDPRGVIPSGVFEELYSTEIQRKVAEMCQGGSSFQSVFKLLEEEIIGDSKTHESFIKAIKKSGITAGSVTQGGIFGDPYFTYEGSVTDISGWIRRFDRLEDVYVKVNRAEDIRTAKKDGKIGIIMNFQNSTQIGNDLAKLDFFHDLGTRIIQLTYNMRNLVGDGCTERTDCGLSRFGVDLVARMNTLGIIVDLSHCGYKTTMDAIECSKKPVAFTHTNCRSLHDHPRNKSDEQIRALADKEGYMGITCHPMFLGKKSKSILNNLLDHIDYAVNLVGIDHIGIGSDFAGLRHYPDAIMVKSVREDLPAQGWRDEDGVKTWERFKAGLERLEHWNMEYASIIRGLISRGYSDHEVEKIIGGNFLSFFEKAVG
jgi:membrane dipeptidase